MSFINMWFSNNAEKKNPACMNLNVNIIVEETSSKKTVSTTNFFLNLVEIKMAGQ